MSKFVLVLVEGQTEEQFVKHVLGPYLQQHDVWLTPTTITNKITKQGDRFKGGVSSFGKIEDDLSRVARNKAFHIVTSMFDLYRLPSDFPGLNDIGDLRGRAKAEYLENAWYQGAGIEHFIPYLQLHEFESLVFAADVHATDVLTGLTDRHFFSRLREEFPCPEDINERPDLSPACRIKEVCPPYMKRFHGSEILARAGVVPLLERCPHFAGWVDKLRAQ